MMKRFMTRLRYGERRFLRSFRRGEKGFTLMELLIVIGILGVLAAVLVPRLSTFFSTGQMAAANQEVANCETGALAFYADADGTWPASTNTTGADTSLRDGPGDEVYLSKDAAHANYTYDVDGKCVVADGTASLVDADIEWDATNHKWVKA